MSDQIRDQLEVAAAEMERLRRHSVTLNSVGWLMAVALGDVAGDAERVKGDPVEQVTRLIAQRDATRRDLAAATTALARIRDLCDEAEYVRLAVDEPDDVPLIFAVAVSDLLAVLPAASGIAAPAAIPADFPTMTRAEHEAYAHRVFGDQARWCPERKVWHHAKNQCRARAHETLPTAGADPAATGGEAP